MKKTYSKIKANTGLTIKSDKTNGLNIGSSILSNTTPIIKSIILMILTAATLFSFSTFAGDLNHCAIKSHSCQFYQCAEESFQCGHSGYFQAFATPYCSLFLSDSFLQKNSNQAQAWLVDVAACLQQAVKESAADNNNMTCSQVRLKAIQAHAQCYYKTGFCQIPRNDRMRLVGVLIKDTWNDFDILKQGLEIQMLCGPQWQQNFDKE